MKAVVAAFNQEKVLVGAFSVIVQPVVEPMDRFAALVVSYLLCPRVVSVSLYTRVMAGLGGVRAGCQVGGGRGRPEKRLISALLLDTSVGIRFNSSRHCTDTALLHHTPSLLAGQGSFGNI